MTPFEDLALLRAFVRIVESGSISAAARTLKIPQPTLSRHLRTLEERSATTLLLRDTHRMSVTAAGHRVLDSARAILALADDAAQRLHQDQSVLRGHLRLFATIDLGQTAVTRFLAQFLLDHPGLTAELAYTNRPVQMIEEGFDAGVVAGRITDDRVVARPAGIIARYLLASPGLALRGRAPKEPADLKSWSWASLAGRQFGGDPGAVVLLGPKQATRTLRIEPVLVCEGVTSLRQAVLSGLAVAVLPEWLVRDDLAAGRLVRVLPKWSARDLPLNVIFHGERHAPLRVRTLIDAAATWMQTEMTSARAPHQRPAVPSPNP